MRRLGTVSGRAPEMSECRGVSESKTGESRSCSQKRQNPLSGLRLLQTKKSLRVILGQSFDLLVCKFHPAPGNLFWVF